jgi:hypothetical protein
MKKDSFDKSFSVRRKIIGVIMGSGTEEHGTLSEIAGRVSKFPEWGVNVIKRVNSHREI